MANLLDFYRTYPDEKACKEYLADIRWGDFPTCPHCTAKGAYFFEKRGIYKCADCRKQFSVRTGTIFEDSRLPLQKWFLAIYLLTSRKKGISSMQLSRDLGITQKTAWFVLQRVRYAMDTPEFKAPLSGVVEADETYIGGRKKGGKRGRGTSKAPVLGAIQRGGQVRATVVKRVNGSTIATHTFKNVESGSLLMTDELQEYKWLGRHFKHNVVKHSVKEYVRGSVYTNNIECFWSHLKRGINGVYLHVSKKHLQRYCDEYTYRFNTREMTDTERFERYLAIVRPKITYQQLTTL